MKIKWVTNALTKENLPTNKPTMDHVNKMCAERLYGSVDSAELKKSSKSDLSTKWISKNAHMIRGSEFIRNIHVHINTVPSR